MAEFTNEGNPIKTNISWAFVGNPERVPTHSSYVPDKEFTDSIRVYRGKNDILDNSGIIPVDKKTKD